MRKIKPKNLRCICDDCKSLTKPIYDSTTDTIQFHCYRCGIDYKP